MKPIDRNEILGLGDYEEIRARFRERVVALKKKRRVLVGDHISVVFENRDSVLLQIQEMLRTERISNEAGIAHEIETYNDLIPGQGQVSMTLLVEIADRETRERMLVELAGLENAVFLEVDGERFQAKGKFFGVLEGRTTAVHYFKIDLPEPARVSIRSKKAKVSVVVAHERHPSRADLSPATLGELAEDLS